MLWTFNITNHLYSGRAKEIDKRLKGSWLSLTTFTGDVSITRVIRSEVLAVMNFHGFDKDAAVFSNFYNMSKAKDCPYTKRRPIDIEAAVGREGTRPARPMTESSRTKCGSIACSPQVYH